MDVSKTYAHAASTPINLYRPVFCLTFPVSVKSLGNFEKQMNCLDHCARHQPGPPTSGCTTIALVEMSAEFM